MFRDFVMHSFICCITFLLPHAFAETVITPYTRDENGVVTFAEPLANNDCWQFTWVGPVDESVQTQPRTCNDIAPEDICNEPLIFTNGTNPNNQPDMTQVAAMCGGSQGNYTCTCTRRGGQSCVKYTKFLQGTDTAVYTSSFCGTGVENSNFGTVPINNNRCPKTAGPLGYEIEACFCQDSLCNAASTMSATSMLLSFLLCIFLIKVIS